VELSPRLQETLSIIKSHGEVEISDLALELKVSYKTAKSYVKDLARLGYVEEVGEDKVRFKQPDGMESVDKLKKVVELHDTELYALRRELEALRQEVLRLKRFAERGKI
jgi:Mn-dependent DtxR family transcriptional regulator